ncbi:MAG: hypothetical protein U0936_04690 [Planctomycetaceae bacterium]
MARNEADREDLIREAVALTERVELFVPGFQELITIGFRSNGAMSIFVGQDPVYQFDPSGRLRRAFVGGFLFRSQHSGLARLQRVRAESEVQLLRYDLSLPECSAFRQAMTATLRCILLQLQDKAVRVERCVPETADLAPQLATSIGAVLNADNWLSQEIRKRSR